MKNQLVSYEIASKLKELGFDEECFCTYHNAELSRNPSHKMDATPIQGIPYTWKNSKVHNSVICAPLWQQVIDWLREKHKIRVCNVISYDEIKNIHVHFLILTDDRNCITISNNDYYKSREQAILKAIELCKKN